MDSPPYPVFSTEFKGCFWMRRRRGRRRRRSIWGRRRRRIT